MVIGLSLHTALSAAVMVGNGLTVMVTEESFTHPLASVPVTVYVVAAAGVTVSGHALAGHPLFQT